MADTETTQLHVDITGDGGSLVAALSPVSQILARMEADLRSVSSTGTSMAASVAAAGKTGADGVKSLGSETKNLGDTVKGTKAETNGLVDGLKQLADHSRTAAIGFEQIGLEAGAAGSRLAGFAEVMERVAGAAPELLAIGVALAAASVAFGILKESVDAAAESQRQLVQIGALLRDQGIKDWQEQAEAVEQYADQLARTSTFAKGEFLTGIQSMITAGMSLNDALHSQSAAEDLAIAKGESLTEAEQQLADAYNGRMRGLTALGIVTKDEVKNGLDYETILQRIEQRMGGASADALDTYTGKMQNFGTIAEDAKDQLGEALLPVLETLADDLTNAVEAAQPLIDQFDSWAEDETPALQDGLNGVRDMLGDLAQTVMPAFEQGVEDGLDSLAEFGKWVGDNKDAIKDFFELTVAIGGILAFQGLATAAGTAITAMTGSTWWTVVTLGLEAIESGIWSEVAAWGSLAVAEAAATFGLSAVIAALVGGAVWVWNNWDTTMSALSEWWADLVITVDHAVSSILDSVAQMAKGLADAVRGVPGIGGKLADGLDAGAALASAGARGAAQNANDTWIGQHPQSSPKTYGPGSGDWGPDGKKKKPKKPKVTKSTHHIDGTATSTKDPGETTTSFTPADYKSNGEDVNNYAAAQKALEAQLKATSAGESELAENIKTAGTVEEQRSAQAAYDAKVLVDLVGKQQMLKDAISDEVVQQRSLSSAQSQAEADATKATAAYNAYGEAINNGGKQTVAQQNELAVLKDKMDQANKSVDELSKQLASVTSNLNTNRASLAQVNEQLDAFKNKNAEAVAAASRSWEEFLAKRKSQMADETATQNLNDAQKIAFFSKTLGDLTAENAKYQSDLLTAQAALLAAQVALEAAHTSAARTEAANRVRIALGEIATITDEITANEKHREQILNEYDAAVKAQINSQQEAHKKMLDTIESEEKGFLDDILTKHQSLRQDLQDVWNDILGDFVKMLEEMIVKSALLQGVNNSIASMFGVSGGSGGSSPMGAFGALFGSSSGSAMPAPYSAGYATGAADGAGDGWTDSDTPTNVNIASAGGTSITNSNPLATNLTQVGGKLMMGAAIGGTIASIDGGNQTNGALLGALGGLFGPIGAVAGGVIGSLIGPKYSAATNPDMDGNVAGYQQDLHNWQGNTGAAAQYDPGQGGTAEDQQMEAWAAANKGNTSLTPDQQALLQQITQLDGGNSSADLTVENLHQGMLTLANGQVISAAQMEQLSESFSQYGAGDPNSAVPAFTLTRSYPDFNLASVAAQTAAATGASTTGSASGGGSINRAGLGFTGDINVDLSGSTIVGAEGLESVGVQISQVLQRVQNGEVAGSNIGLRSIYSP